MSRLRAAFHSLLSSGAEFNESEDYLAFRFRLLNAVMLTGLVFSGLFILVDWLGMNELGPRQLLATKLNWIATLGLLFLLRGRKQHYQRVAVLVVAVNFLTFASALVFVINDELRVVWFYLAVFFSYVLIGSRAGLVVTGLSVVVIVAANQILPLPFSRNAMATLLISLGVVSAFSDAYTRRAASYFERMTATLATLRDLASKDPLTGLLNPRAYYEMGDRMLRLARRRESSLSVLFIDLDHFKRINDQYGHEVGDAVLMAVAGCLAAQLRQSDVLGRIGGEEFVVCLPDTEVEGAVRLAETLRAAIERLDFSHIPGQPVQVTASIGVATSRPSDQGLGDIQMRADGAMYKAKSAGRNRVMRLSDV